MIKFAYNTAVNETTNFTPFKLLYGREARFPNEMSMGTATYTGMEILGDIEDNFRKILNAARDNISVKQHKAMIRADKIKPAITYRIGELVWLYTPQRSTKLRNEGNLLKLAKKLKKPWQGPYEVVKQVSPNTVKLRMEHGARLIQIVHVNRLKQYKERMPTLEPTLAEEDEFNPELEKVVDNSTTTEENTTPREEEIIAEITNHKVKNGKIKYLAKFKNGNTS